LIERHRLVAPDDACAQWPFRLRVRVLGGFDLARDGEPMRFTGKTQQRPLDLLKFVVSLGGKDIDVETVMAALWPDADGAAAKSSFDSAMFRLRKLLDVEDALELTSGKLSLNKSLVWTDVWALDAALDHANDAPPSAAAHRLLAAYPGPLLGSEESPWLAKPRDALRARVVRALMDLGQKLERAGAFASAVDVYRRALEADNLAESLYRGLMRALAASGDRAEAMNAFRRCRELLSIVLGVKPSAETDRLYQDIANR
jgi:DNA-binding SARP family transcriptional activator